MYQEWSLIQSVVDWDTIVEKFLDSRGEKSSRGKNRRITRRERRRTMHLAKSAQLSGVADEAAKSFNKAADETVVTMNVVNSLRV